MAPSWQALYQSPWQSVWGLTLGSVLFLGWLAGTRRPDGAGVEPRAAAFVRIWAWVFAVESILDATVPALAGVSMLPFVLLGDFRVFLLVEVVSRPERPRGDHLLRAAALTLIVPVVALAGYVSWTVAHDPPPAPLLEVVAGASSSPVLWLMYETAFVVVALALRAVVVPARRPPALAYLRAVLAYVAAYYVLWAVADVVILAGADWGWALRIVPNQLYYGLFVPVAYGLFFAPSRAAARMPVQVAR